MSINRATRLKDIKEKSFNSKVHLHETDLDHKGL